MNSPLVNTLCPSSCVSEKTTTPPEPSFELERLVFFSDAVFAIALTLLAIELRVPTLSVDTSDELLRAIFAEWPKFLAFAMSFWIVALYWRTHHRYFRYINRFENGLIGRNLLMLFSIVCIPFTMSVLGEYGNLSAASWLYALNMAVLGFSSAWLWHYATAEHHLVAQTLDQDFIRYILLRALSTPLAAVIVILLTVVIGGAASAGFFLIFVFQRILARVYRGHTQPI